MEYISVSWSDISELVGLFMIPLLEVIPSKSLRSWQLRNVCDTKNHKYVPFVVITIWSFSRSWFITEIVARVTRRVQLEEQKLVTLPEHLGSPTSFTCLKGVRVLMSKYTFVILYCEVRCHFRVKTMLCSPLLPLLCMSFVFVYVYWCPTWFSH